MSLRLFARLSFSDIAIRLILKNVGSVKILGKEINFRWKTSQNPKVHQRAINRVMRAINENIYNDDLWMGRFFVRQYSRQVVMYDGELHMAVELRFYDHKTKKYSSEWLTSNDIIVFGGSKIWSLMNDFIVEDLDVWRTENVREEKQDWRAASIEKTIRESRNLWQRV